MSKFDALRTFKVENEAPERQQQAVGQAASQQPAQTPIHNDGQTDYQTDVVSSRRSDIRSYSRQYDQTPSLKVRPIGKRSDPDFKMFSHLMRKDTQRKAAMKLLRLNDGRDMSEILEALLSAWADKPDEHS